MLPDAQPAVDNWIFRVFISCAIIAIINGKFFFSVLVWGYVIDMIIFPVRCLVDHETECPNCAREHGVIREIRRNNERLADQHAVFLSEVREKGFVAVAGAFSRGALNMSRLDDIAA
jgi:hypothetical protein